MNSTFNHRPVSLYALLGALLFIAFGGFYGGGAFLLDKSGAMLGMTTDFLARAPVRDYTLPGLFLMIVMGALPLALAYGLWRRPAWMHNAALEQLLHQHVAWTTTLIFSILLLGWLCYQALLIDFEAPIQWVIAVVGLLTLGLSLLPQVRRYYALH